MAKRAKPKQVVLSLKPDDRELVQVLRQRWDLPGMSDMDIVRLALRRAAQEKAA